MVVLTFWLMALAPAVSQALAASGGSGWSQICSTSNAPQDDDGPATMFEHCPLCSLHAQDLAPPPAADTQPLITGLQHLMPERFLSAGHTLNAWRSSQARAPPR
jgi:hypothetical protein